MLGEQAILIFKWYTFIISYFFKWYTFYHVFEAITPHFQMIHFLSCIWGNHTTFSNDTLQMLSYLWGRVHHIFKWYTFIISYITSNYNINTKCCGNYLGKFINQLSANLLTNFHKDTGTVPQMMKFKSLIVLSFISYWAFELVEI